MFLDSQTNRPVESTSLNVIESPTKRPYITKPLSNLSSRGLVKTLMLSPILFIGRIITNLCGFAMKLVITIGIIVLFIAMIAKAMDDETKRAG